MQGDECTINGIFGFESFDIMPPFPCKVCLFQNLLLGNLIKRAEFHHFLKIIGQKKLRKNVCETTKAASN